MKEHTTQMIHWSTDWLNYWLIDSSFMFHQGIMNVVCFIKASCILYVPSRHQQSWYLDETYNIGWYLDATYNIGWYLDGTYNPDDAWMEPTPWYLDETYNIGWYINRTYNLERTYNPDDSWMEHKRWINQSIYQSISLSNRSI